MILLDTNIVSEGWRPNPNARALAWLNAQPANVVYLCTPVLAELRLGHELLAPGLRRDRLYAWINRMESEVYRGQILGFDIPATHEFGRVVAFRQRSGRRIEPMDAMIAAIALTHGAKLATRDVRDFADLGLDLINPFDPPVT
jgi:toxin FitB